MSQNWIHEPSNSLLVLGDFNCNYNIFPYAVDPNLEIVIKGQYPHARYMSITVNGEFDIAIASAPDHEIMPDPGSTNPFLPGANWDAKNRNYTLIVRFTPPPPGSNHFVPGAGNNIIYAGTLPSGRPNTSGIITMRIYVPSIGYDETGGVGLPTICYQVVKDAQSLMEIPESNRFARLTNRDNSGWLRINDDNTDHNCDLIWSKTNRLQSELLQANPNTSYILSNELRRDPGKLLYIRWKAPTVPDTYYNNGIVGNEDMRYWSMMAASHIGFLGLYTLGDFQMIVDDDGYVNLVIGFGAERPANVTAENGFTWADLSNLPMIPIVIIYRNTLISPSFPFSAKDVPMNQVVSPEVMGDYYPCGKYVEPLYFSPCSYEADQEVNE